MEGTLHESLCIFLIFFSWIDSLLNVEASRSYSDTSHSVGLSGRVIRLTQRPVQNTQHSQEKDIHAPARFEHTIPASE